MQDGTGGDILTNGCAGKELKFTHCLPLSPSV
jgi:hypothetical protein